MVKNQTHKNIQIMGGIDAVRKLLNINKNCIYKYVEFDHIPAEKILQLYCHFTSSSDLIIPTPHGNLIFNPQRLLKTVLDIKPQKKVLENSNLLNMTI